MKAKDVETQYEQPVVKSALKNPQTTQQQEDLIFHDFDYVGYEDAPMHNQSMQSHIQS